MYKMKLNTLLSRLALVTLSLPMANVAMAEDCSASYYCYGNSVNFSRINVVVDEQADAHTINITPQPAPVVIPAPSAVPNRPLTTPIARPTPANNANCRTQYDEQLAKAAKLDALARTQAQRGQEQQAQRLFTAAAQIRSAATRMNCR
jgi:hypothetical protein